MEQQQEQQPIQPVKKTSKLRLVLYVIIGLVALYYTVRLATRKEKFQENKELLNRIDSLQKVTIQLKEEQKKITARDSSFNESINKIDAKIGDVQAKKTVIENHYHNQSKVIPRYTPTQLDSFFKKRYNY
jgi:hypothetical protein